MKALVCFEFCSFLKVELIIQCERACLLLGVFFPLKIEISNLAFVKLLMRNII